MKTAKLPLIHPNTRRLNEILDKRGLKKKNNPAKKKEITLPTGYKKFPKKEE